MLVFDIYHLSIRNADLIFSQPRVTDDDVRPIHFLMLAGPPLGDASIAFRVKRQRIDGCCGSNVQHAKGKVEIARPRL